MPKLRDVRWACLLYFLVIGALVIVVIATWPRLWSIWREHATTFLGSVLLMAVGMLVQMRNFIEFVPRPHSIEPWPFLRVWAVSSLTNYAGPFQPGVAIRVLYLRNCGIGIGSSALATLRQAGVSAWMAIGGISLGLLWVQRGYSIALLLLAAFVFILLLRRVLVEGLCEISRPHWLARSAKFLSAAIEGTSRTGVAGIVAQYGIGTVLLLWCYRSFGVDVAVGEALLLACAVYLSSLVAVLPGNLGLSEGIYFLGGHALGMTAHEAAAVAVFLRASHVVSCFVVAGVTSVRWRRAAVRSSL